jgi:hypothetical protein
VLFPSNSTQQPWPRSLRKYNLRNIDRWIFLPSRMTGNSAKLVPWLTLGTVPTIRIVGDLLWGRLVSTFKEYLFDTFVPLLIGYRPKQMVLK